MLPSSKLFSQCDRTQDKKEYIIVINKYVPGMSPIWCAKIQREVKVTDADAKQTALRKKASEPI